MRAALLLCLVAFGCGGPQHATETESSRRATLLFFSDAHGQLEAHPELFWTADRRTEVQLAGGYARLAHVVETIRAESGGRTMLIDGGDTFQGSGPAAWSGGAALVEPQRALGIELAVPGNWEVVHGPAAMRSLLAAAGYPVIAANIVDERTGEPVFPPTLLRELGGIRFGFVGFTDPDVPMRQSPAYSKGLRYLDSSVLAPHVARLREQADVVVLVAHVGLARTLALVESIEGIDLVLSGDTHERTYAPLRGGPDGQTLVVEPGAFASLLGRVDVELVPGARPRLAWELLELRADRYPESPRVKRIVDAALAPYRDREDRTLGTTHVPLERYGVVENSADEVIVDAIRAATGTEIALSNGFRFGHPLRPGPIRERDLWFLLPVSTRLRTGTVTGEQLRAFWEEEIDHVFAEDPKRLFGGWLPRVSGMTVRFRTDRPRGQRVTSLEVNGAPLDDARRYTIAACEREGDRADALCRIHGVADARTLDLDVHAAVRAYLGARDAIREVRGARVIADDLPARVLSQFERR
jgi:2',3'-cyclic-nucleotide 2'-phosphodiesterase (5'-nucleotidase family)